MSCHPQTLNVRDFINEIKKRRLLWDQGIRCYYYKGELCQGWKDVAKRFNMDVNLVKTKWKNLRDTFRIELKKMNKLPGNPKSNWSYYEDMYFLKDYLKTKNKSDSKTASIVKLEEDSEITLSPTRLIDNDDDYDDDDDNLDNTEIIDNDENDNDIDINDKEDQSSTSSSKIVIKSFSSLAEPAEFADSTNVQIKKCVKRKLPENNIDDNDDDMLFFRSLAPFVKRLDQDKKLLFRMNVQQMLYKELYDN